MVELLPALALWLLTGFLTWLYQYRSSRLNSTFDAFMIGPCMILGPISLILMVYYQDTK